MNSPQPKSARLVRALVRLAIGAFSLLLLRVIVPNLPMLTDAPRIPGVLLSYVSVGRAVIDTVIFVLLVKFGSELSLFAGETFPQIPDVGRLARLAVWVGTTVLAYTSYSDIAFALLRGETWIYSLAFLFIAGIPLVLLASMIYKNVDAISELVMKPMSGRQAESTACPRCGAAMGASTRFCGACGADVTTLKPTVEPLTCVKCHTTLRPDQKFCTKCGEAVKRLQAV